MRYGSYAQFAAARAAEGDRFYLQTVLIDRRDAFEGAHATSLRGGESAAVCKAGTAGVAAAAEVAEAGVGGSGELEAHQCKCVGDLLGDVKSFGWEWLDRVMAHRPQGRPYAQSQVHAPPLLDYLACPAPPPPPFSSPHTNTMKYTMHCMRSPSAPTHRLSWCTALCGRRIRRHPAALRYLRQSPRPGRPSAVIQLGA